MACFKGNEDRHRYLDLLARAALEHGVAIHSYVLMSNHVHLLVTPENSEACGRMMQSLGRQYVRLFNDRYQRTGTLWEGRFKSTLVDTDAYFFTVTRYIELNPVRAGIVAQPGAYRWSSYRSNALGAKDSLLSSHAVYRQLGRDPQERQRSYRLLFEHEIEPQVLDGLREATNKGWAFGSKRFKDGLRAIANRPPESLGWGGDRKSNNDQGL